MYRVSHRIKRALDPIDVYDPALPPPRSHAHLWQLHRKCALPTARARDRPFEIDARNTAAGPGAVIGKHVELQSGHRIVPPVGFRDIDLADNCSAGEPAAPGSK